MKKIYTIILGLLFTTTVFGQNISKTDSLDHLNILKSFIFELADPNKAVDVILSQYVIVEEPSDEIYDYLDVSLEEVRINLISKKLDEIQYIPFSKMERKEIRDIDPEGLDTNEMYFLYYKNRQMLAVYMEHGKVASFTLVSKGNNKAHFVLY